MYYPQKNIFHFFFRVNILISLAFLENYTTVVKQSFRCQKKYNSSASWKFCTETAHMHTHYQNFITNLKLRWCSITMYAISTNSVHGVRSILARISLMTRPANGTMVIYESFHLRLPKKLWQFTKLRAKDWNRENKFKPLPLSVIFTVVTVREVWWLLYIMIIVKLGNFMDNNF